MTWRQASLKDKVEALKDAYANGDNSSSATLARTLAQQFGVPISRNVVIGFVRRHAHLLPGIHLNGGPGAVYGKPAKRKSERSAPRHQPEAKIAPTANLSRKIGVPLEDMIAKPAPVETKNTREPKTLMDLGAFECKWIVEGTGHAAMFCAASTTDPKSSWCSEHARRAYTPTLVRLR